MLFYAICIGKRKENMLFKYHNDKYLGNYDSLVVV